MHSVLILGAGKIGSTIAGLLATSGDYRVVLADARPDAARMTQARLNGGVGPEVISALQLDAGDPNTLKAALHEHGVAAVISGLPYALNPAVARVARLAGVHYFDLTEDIASTTTVVAIAAGAKTAFVPQCGLAPGFVNIVAADLMNRLTSCDYARLRVGALPRNPDNVLRYALTWSTEGLINEYGNPCLAVVDGRVTEVAPLQGLEALTLDGTNYEAFNTSGGLATLPDTFHGRVRSLDYKTIRYPGHCELVSFLMNDLRLNEDRDTLRRILERALPTTQDDVVVLHVEVSGRRGNAPATELHSKTFYPKVIGGHRWTAIQWTTAAAVCAVVDLVLQAPQQFAGAVRQERFALEDFLANRFGGLCRK